MRTTTAISACVLALTTIAQTSDDSMLAGITARRTDDARSAPVAMDPAMNHEPASGTARYSRAVSRLEQGDASGALEDLDLLLDLAPTDAHAILRRAEAHTMMGETRLAKTDLYRVLGIQANGPAVEQALSELGRLAMEDSDLPTALAHYDHLVAIAAFDAQAWCSHGKALSTIRDDDRAIADLEKAIELDPTLDEAYVELAMILFRQGRKQEGCYALQQAKDLGDRSVEELMMVHCDK